MASKNYRVGTVKVADKGSIQATSAAIVFEKILKDVYNPVQEEIYVIVFNNRMRVVDTIMIARGGIACVTVENASIFRSILMTNGTSFIIAHNHPSGDATPSVEDKQFTDKLVMASQIMGIKFLDHIVFTDEEHFSFRSNGFIE